DLDLAAQSAQAGPFAIEKSPQPLQWRLGMKLMKKEHAAGERIIRQAIGRIAGEFENPFQAKCVQVEYGLHQAARRFPRGRVRQGLQRRDQRLDPTQRLPKLRGHDLFPGAPNAGTWRSWISFPPPRYMCTPQGRQGSKLRTVRMMSMPLKLSRSFSSKIGVSSTASS